MACYGRRKQGVEYRVRGELEREGRGWISVGGQVREVRGDFSCWVVRYFVARLREFRLEGERFF